MTENDDENNNNEDDDDNLNGYEDNEDQHRRSLIESKVANYKELHLSKKDLSMNCQLLDCAREEIAIKKRILDQMTRIDKEYRKDMNNLNSHLQSLNNTMSQGFALMQSVLVPTPASLSPQAHTSSYSTYPRTPTRD